MSFYKRSIHSFLGQTNTKTMTFHENEIIGSLEAKGLLGIGIAEEANGLKLCTEYLGFESYDMKMSENEVEDKMMCLAEKETERVERKRRKTTEDNVVVAPAREGKREFPPPLSSLNNRGQRSFYLRPVRKDGRLELTQVMIDRPEIFHASRENGRLRLHLVDGQTTRKDAICDGNLRGQKSVDNRIEFHCDSEEVVDLKDEPKDYAAASDELVDVSMFNDDSGAGSLRYKSNKESSTDEHGARTWRYKNRCKSKNHEENEYHHHHQHYRHHHHHHHRHYHIHPYLHYNSNNNMHLWSRSYVKTWS